MPLLVRINQGRIVPWQFRLAGTVLVFMLIFGAFITFSEIYAISAAIALSFLLPLIWSSYYVLEIDPGKKLISDITWIMGYKKADKTPYNALEKIFINKIHVGQRITSYSGHVHNARSIEYTAFLKTDSGKKYELISDADLQKLQKKLKPISKKLDCEVIENY